MAALLCQLPWADAATLVPGAAVRRGWDLHCYIRSNFQSWPPSATTRYCETSGDPAAPYLATRKADLPCSADHAREVGAAGTPGSAARPARPVDDGTSIYCRFCKKWLNGAQDYSDHCLGTNAYFTR